MMLRRLLIWLWLITRLMFSGWSSPNTAVTGAPISASDYNTYQRDNLNYLLSQRPYASIVLEGSSNFSTSSTSFVAVSTSSLRLTITPNSGRVRVRARGVVQHSNTASGAGSLLGGTISLDFLLDAGSTRAGGTNGVLKIIQGNNGTNTHEFAIEGIFTALSVGSHTLDLAWKTSGATALMLNNAYVITMTCEEF